jgi:serine/threonine protein kinase
MIGRYAILALLGEGMMGIVYHGWDFRLERNVGVIVVSKSDMVQSVASPKCSLLAELGMIRTVDQGQEVAFFGHEEGPG